MLRYWFQHDVHTCSPKVLLLNRHNNKALFCSSSRVATVNSKNEKIHKMRSLLLARLVPLDSLVSSTNQQAPRATFPECLTHSRTLTSNLSLFLTGVHKEATSHLRERFWKLQVTDAFFYTYNCGATKCRSLSLMSAFLKCTEGERPKALPMKDGEVGLAPKRSRKQYQNGVIPASCGRHRASQNRQYETAQCLEAEPTA